MPRGRKPKPNALRELEGVRGHHRPLNVAEPEAVGVPICPSWLDCKAKTHWRVVVRELKAIGVVGSVDADALATYCKTWVQWRALCDLIDEHGYAQPGRNSVTARPEVAACAKLVTILRTYQSEFGMTAAGRARLSVDKPSTSKMDEFAKGPKAGEKPKAWTVHGVEQRMPVAMNGSRKVTSNTMRPDSC